MDSPSADEKVEKGKDGASSQEEGSAEDQGEESAALGKREHPTEPPEEKKTKKPRRESRWDSDKEWSKYVIINRKILQDSFSNVKKIVPRSLHRNESKGSPGLPVAVATEQQLPQGGLLGSAPAGLPPLQSTLIVQQQPGQSVYVQQQVGISPLSSSL